jgi:hypothetical protein
MDLLIFYYHLQINNLFVCSNMSLNAVFLVYVFHLPSYVKWETGVLGLEGDDEGKDDRIGSYMTAKQFHTSR